MGFASIDRASITIWVDPDTQVVKVDFTPQNLQPAEYGIVISSLVSHIAKLFVDSNPGVSESDVIEQIMKGLEAGLAQREDIPIPAKAH